MDDQAKQERLIEILQDARFVMLANGGDGDELIAARPMSVARVDDDGTMYMSTAVDSQKADAFRADPRAAITYQASTKYAVVSGTVRVSQDRALIDELWQEDWKVWYPEGKTDPNVAILIFTAEEGQYWDQAGAKGLGFLVRAITARLTGREMESRPGDSEHVTLQPH